MTPTTTPPAPARDAGNPRPPRSRKPRKPPAPAHGRVAWTLTINNQPYALTALRPHPEVIPGPAYRLRKQDGTTYDVAVQAAGRMACDCPDYTYARADRPANDAGECKHGAGLRAALAALGVRLPSCGRAASCPARGNAGPTPARSSPAPILAGTTFRSTSNVVATALRWRPQRQPAGDCTPGCSGACAATTAPPTATPRPCRRSPPAAASNTAEHEGAGARDGADPGQGRPPNTSPKPIGESWPASSPPGRRA